MIKKILLTTSAALLLTATAQAADMARPVPPVPMAERVATLWNGFYVGGHVGYAYHDGDMDAFTPFSETPNGNPGFGITGLANGRVMGGLQAGYNYQMGNVVLGIEATASLLQNEKWSNQNDPGTMFSSTVNWDATLAPRLGYAFDRTLIFAKAGLAVAEFEYGHDRNGTIISGSSTRAGYVVGAGLEYALTQNISIKGEYDYMDFGKGRTYMAEDVWVEPNRRIHTFLVGVNYRF